jgi:hypothetical protein
MPSTGASSGAGKGPTEQFEEEDLEATAPIEAGDTPISAADAPTAGAAAPPTGKPPIADAEGEFTFGVLGAEGAAAGPEAVAFASPGAGDRPEFELEQIVGDRTYGAEAPEALASASSGELGLPAEDVAEHDEMEAAGPSGTEDVAEHVEPSSGTVADTRAIATTRSEPVRSRQTNVNRVVARHHSRQEADDMVDGGAVDDVDAAGADGAGVDRDESGEVAATGGRSVDERQQSREAEGDTIRDVRVINPIVLAEDPSQAGPVSGAPAGSTMTAHGDGV